MQGYCVTCVFNCKPDKIEEMKVLVEHVYVSSLKEKGCLEYRWYQAFEKPEDFLLFMTWESKQAFEDHVSSTHVQDTHQGEGIPSLDDVLRKPFQDLSWKFLKPKAS